MAFRLELSDLPPRYRAQAEAQLAKGRKSGATRWRRRHGPRRSPARSLTAWASMNITSGTVAPKVARGEIVEWEAHPSFPRSRRGNTGI